MKFIKSMAGKALNGLPLPYATKYKIKQSIKRFLSLVHGASASSERLQPGSPQTNVSHAAQANVRHGRPDHALTGRKDVLIFSVIDWHFRIQRPQQLARQFAAQGHTVFYISNHFVDRVEPGFDLEFIEGERLIQVSLYVRGAPAIYFAGPSLQDLKQLEASMRQFLERMNIFSTVSLVEHAFWHPLVWKLPNSLRVYDCMDFHEGFGNVPKELIALEKRLLKESDLVVVTSSWLDEAVRSQNANTCVVRNAGEYEHFSREPSDVFRNAQYDKVIGYFGAIAEWFDVALIEKIARGCPQALIVLIGNDTVGAQRQLSHLPNVMFTGELPYGQLPRYLHAFDVCLLPFKVLPLTLATNPVKVYEYLASGSNVVCTDLPEITQFGSLVAKAADHESFLKCVQEALNTPPSIELQSKRRRFAAEQTWHARVVDLEKSIAEIALPRISVVVLTFNNLDLTRLCLDSVLNLSDYPNLELIVVDNHSTDGTPDYLKELRIRHPEVKIILNQENLGFAAGNNAGLQAASGEFLVMLNNDTVVTPGWALSMLRHFQNNQNLGLLGPVTNNIGNEAKVDVAYSDLVSMPYATRSVTLDNMGKRLPVRNVAFFCVMMPRRVFTEVGFLDENFGRGFFEDDDYCRRVELLGLEIACADDVFVHHHLSASFNQLPSEHKQKLFEQNKAYYESKWGAWVPHQYRPTH